MSNAGPTYDTDTYPLPDVLRFMQMLWAVVHGMGSVSKRMAHDVGVTGPQRLVIRVVGLFPGLSAGALSNTLHLHASTLTGILQRLVAQGLIDRVEDDADRRRAVLRLTSRGRRVNGAATGTVEEAIARALGSVSRRDREATTRVLARLVEQLDSGATAPPQSRTRRPGPKSS